MTPAAIAADTLPAARPHAPPEARQPNAASPPEPTDRFLRAFPARMSIDRASGVHVESEGRRYVDLGGASQGVALLGHNHPRVTAAIHAQAGRLVHVAQAFRNPVREAFLERLHGLLPDAFTKTFLANSGTEANELALKLAGMATQRSGIVAMTEAFHGRTLGALATTHKPAYRSPCAGLLHETAFAPFNDEESLKHHVGPGTAAVILEPVQGEGGVRAATPSFLRTARDLCDDHGALLAFDEVQSGTGRTGTFLACERAGVLPDIVTLGKGLAGGLPIGACAVNAAAADALAPAGHGSTYGGGPLVAAAGLATLDELVEGRWMERASAIGERLRTGIEGLDHPVVQDVQAHGAMIGVDLRRRPAPALEGLAAQGFLALNAGRRQMRLLPPLITEDDHLDAFLGALPSALDAAAPGPRPVAA